MPFDDCASQKLPSSSSKSSQAGAGDLPSGNAEWDAKTSQASSQVGLEKLPSSSSKSSQATMGSKEAHKREECARLYAHARGPLGTLALSRCAARAFGNAPIKVYPYPVFWFNNQVACQMIEIKDQAASGHAVAHVQGRYGPKAVICRAKISAPVTLSRRQPSCASEARRTARSSVPKIANNSAIV
jgi:hypothetical protein